MSLLHPQRQKVFVFNKSAHLLWSALRLGKGVCLPQLLVRRYGIPLAMAERDVAAIVELWVANGLALIGDASPEIDAVEIPVPSHTSYIGQRWEPHLFRLGHLIFCVSADPSVASMITALFSHLRIEIGAPDVVCVAGPDFLVVDGRIIIDGVEGHVVIGGLYKTIFDRLHPTAQWGAMIHAGAAAKNGVAAIFSAPSGSGKSTLTAYLVARGYEYLSDDLVPLMAHGGGVAPFPLPISVKPGSAPVLAPFYAALVGDPKGQTQFIIQHTSFIGPARPAKALVFPRYICGASTRFASLSVQEALARLLRDRIYLGSPLEQATLRKFIDWLQNVNRYELVYCDLQEAEHCISRALMN